MYLSFPCWGEECMSAGFCLSTMDALLQSLIFNFLSSVLLLCLFTYPFWALDCLVFPTGCSLSTLLCGLLKLWTRSNSWSDVGQYHLNSIESQRLVDFAWVQCVCGGGLSRNGVAVEGVFRQEWSCWVASSAQWTRDWCGSFWISCAAIITNTHWALWDF